ncbi:archaellum component FlaC [Sphingomonas jinjuensis]|uniref:Archaellum component FlaC n=1 Tax=Sphingomonas jinjuensis TaxID=535907 RepID=A0A840FMS8_9SPHN|nr:archaellum component FlaC [Sphingomonas jinjuensis]
MSDVTPDLIYSVLQKLQSDVSEMKFDMRDLKVRMTMVEEHLGSSIIAISGVNSRLDRLNDRVERIENRLDLTDHA